jgi:hypothetical protein
LNFNALGPKDEDFRVCHQLPFIERNIEQYSNFPEDVDSYSAAILGRLLRWMTNALKLRKQDIIRRLSLQRRAKEQREEAITKEEKRQERHQLELAEAEKEFIENHRDEITEIEALIKQRE